MGGEHGIPEVPSKWPGNEESKILVVFGPTVSVDSMGNVVTKVNIEDVFADENIVKELNNLSKPNDKQTAIAHEIHNLIKTQIDNLKKSPGNVAILGGINIKVEDSTDLFLPLVFET